MMYKRKFSQQSLDIIAEVNEMISSCKKSNKAPTTTDIYKWLVFCGVLERGRKDYKKLVSIIGKARKAGLIGWDDIYGTKQPRPEL